MYLKKTLKSTQYSFPQSSILLIDNFLKKKFFKKILKEIIFLENNSKSIKNFALKRKSLKKEFLNYSEFYSSQKKLINFLSSKKFKDFLKFKFNISGHLYPDKTNMYSGFNIVEKNGFLRPHADFNYNSNLKKYRTINLLLYFNKNWKKKYGGNLAFYNYSNMKKKYEFLAKENRALIFLTNKFTPHGYKKITVDKKRISLNFYYYTKENLSFSEQPHKTIWR
jgi:Rps23 Pro-64 3,4-dihydroxylase Tpa1-like proline 4-hydroxylase